jgi:hypothetical protein
MYSAGCTRWVAYVEAKLVQRLESEPFLLYVHRQLSD